ncbi:MAG: hypothetical protein ACFCAD_23625 [Pleurocapsa sp.]
MTIKNNIDREKERFFKLKDKKYDLENNQIFFYKPFNLSTQENFHQFLYFKRLLGCLSYDIVIRDDEPLQIEDYVYNYHNLFHYEISNLDRINMGKDRVSGIHGFYSPMFHDRNFEPEYNGMLDEARVAIHEWITRTSIFSTFKALNRIIWIASIRVNPMLVIVDHTKSIKEYNGDKLFDLENNQKLNLYNFLQNFI